MKILMSNPDKTLGFVLPESNSIQEIGLFDPELLKAQIKSLKAFNAFMENVGTPVVKLAIFDNGHNKCLAMRPADDGGEAWVVLAPHVRD